MPLCTFDHWHRICFACCNSSCSNALPMEEMRDKIYSLRSGKMYSKVYLKLMWHFSSLLDQVGLFSIESPLYVSTDSVSVLSCSGGIATQRECCTKNSLTERYALDVSNSSCWNFILALVEPWNVYLHSSRTLDFIHHLRNIRNARFTLRSVSSRARTSYFNFSALVNTLTLCSEHT